MSNISIDDLTSEIAKELANYSQGVTESVKIAVDVTAKEVNEEIKKHVTFNEKTGKYIKAFRLKTTHESKFGKTKTWCVVDGQYRLTHLLENGHVNRDGSRSKSFPHIKFGEELAKENLQKRIEEAIESK